MIFVCCMIAMAAWLSEQWLWTLPALIGVIIGVAISRAGRQGGPLAGHALTLGTILLVASFVYLYVLLLVFWLRDPSVFPVKGIMASFVCVLFLLLGLGAMASFGVRMPTWISRLGDALLKDR